MRYADHNGSLGWPPEMQIRVAAHPRFLLELLWIRHVALGSTRPDLPGADLPTPPERDHDPSVSAEWDDLWILGLEDARSNAVRAPASGDRSTRHSYEERIKALATRLSLAPAEPVAAWEARLFDNIGAEVLNAEELVTAWRAGLRYVVDLPFTGEYSARISHDTMLVSTAVRTADPMAYLRALSAFARR